MADPTGLGHNELVLLKLAYRKGAVTGRHVVPKLAREGLLAPVSQGEVAPGCDPEYRLTEKGREALAASILLGSQG